MRLFGRKRDDEPVDMNERSPQLGLKYKDLMVLDQLMKSGADLTASRHVIYRPARSGVRRLGGKRIEASLGPALSPSA